MHQHQRSLEFASSVAVHISHGCCCYGDAISSVVFIALGTSRALILSQNKNTRHAHRNTERWTIINHSSLYLSHIVSIVENSTAECNIIYVQSHVSWLQPARFSVSTEQADVYFWDMDQNRDRQSGWTGWELDRGEMSQMGRRGRWERKRCKEVRWG